MSALAPSDRAPNLLIGDGVDLAPDASLGANVVIHPGVVVGSAATIQDGVVLGKRPVLRPGSSAPAAPEATLSLGAGVVVCTGAVVFAGATVGAGTIVGDQAHVREGTAIGEMCVIGRGSAVGAGARLGARVNLQTNVWITSLTVVEDDAFIGPGAVTMNDDTMDRLGPGDDLDPPHLARACRVGGGALITPGVRIGEEAFVGAGAVVTRDVPPRAVVMGIPARVTGTVSEADFSSPGRSA